MASDDNRGSAGDASNSVSRRRMLTLSSAAVATGLAGCSGGNENPQTTTTGTTTGTGTGTGETSGEVKEDTIETFISRLPTRMTWNPWSTTYPWTTSWVVCEPMVRYFANGDVKLNVVKDWSYDENEQVTTVEFEEGWKWWNGDPVTAEDKYTFEELRRLMDPEGSSLERLEMPDDYTLKRYHKNPQNPQLLEYSIGGWLGTQIRGHRDTYRQWLDKFADVSQQSERNQLQEQLGNEMKIPTQQLIDEGLGTAPYKAVEANSQEMVFEKFEDHPHADQITIPKLRLVVSKDQALAQRIKNGDLDFGFGLIEEWVGGEGVAPEYFKNVGEYRGTYMRKLEFGMLGDAAAHVRKLEVRRAIAYAINAQHIITNLDGQNYPIEAQAGLPVAVAEKWVGQDQLDKYIQYPVESDTDQASQYMEQAGYTRNGDDKWVDADGNTITLEFPVAQHRATQGKTISDQLKQFGFEVNFMAMSSTNLSAKYKDSPTYDITLSSHGDLVAHPHSYFRTNHQFGHELGEDGAVERWLADGKERSEFIGRELKPEIPTEVGATDLSGETETVNLFELEREWETAQTDEQNKEIARKFSWFWNFHLPQIDIFQQGDATWLDMDNFQAKNTDAVDWHAYRANFWNLKRGNIAARME